MQRKKDFHQNLFRRIGVICAKIQTLSVSVNQFKLVFPTKELNVQIFQRAVKSQMPLNPVAVSYTHLDVYKRQPLLQPADRQQIFHQIDQPHGIVINVRIHLPFGRFIKQLSVGQKVAGISRN